MDVQHVANMAPRLILTGFMGTGKSSIAPIVARRLSWPVIDCDELLVKQAGKSIAEIFDSEGEARFRELERMVIQGLTAKSPRCPQCANPRPAVVSSGGGALVDDRNYHAMSKAGIIVCLSARPEVIARRVERSRTRRPKLLEGGKPVRKRVAELLEQRRDSYARAQVTIDTSDLSIERAADAVLAGFIARWAKGWVPSESN